MEAAGCFSGTYGIRQLMSPHTIVQLHISPLIRLNPDLSPIYEVINLRGLSMA
jgi:hypothetical protein